MSRGESLCPDCAAFTTDILDPVYRSDLKHVVDLDYIAWGNAKNASGSPECQHGPRECKLNKALNCAQHYSRTQEDFFIFLLCLEKTAFSTGDDEVLEICSSHANLSEKNLRHCMEGKLGEQLEAEAAQATPPHQYVPWILVNGVPLGADCGNLVTYICTAYQGEKPRVCSEPQTLHKCPGAPSEDSAGLQLMSGASR
ncbi:g4296 [Coccomyxa viridis]|uniref:G4296 protein n=1 Tax=Coccomyxa viridis TaxID=1274662 RepID=A0ABP1FSQ8_9CHLO